MGFPRPIIAVRLQAKSQLPSNPFPKSIYDNVVYGARLNGYKGDLDELVETSLRRAALWINFQKFQHLTPCFECLTKHNIFH